MRDGSEERYDTEEYILNKVYFGLDENLSFPMISN